MSVIKRSLIVSALLLLAGVAWLFANKSENGANAVEPGEILVADQPSHPQVPVTDNSGGSTRVNNPFPGVRKTRKGLSLTEDPFFAESAAEQAWLDRHGYPNAEQWKVYTQASDSQLQIASAQGDRAAKAPLLQRDLMAGEEGAIAEMLGEGATGSIFALELLSSTLANRPNDRVMAYAVSRVAEMNGNSRIAGGRDLMFKKPLTSVEKVDAEQEAFRIYADLSRSSSFRVDPRPIVSKP